MQDVCDAHPIMILLLSGTGLALTGWIEYRSKARPLSYIFSWLAAGAAFSYLILKYLL
jgi:hypothetical protein